MTTALVTGASRGIGRAIAVALASRGDRVAVHYGSNLADAEETRRLLPGDGHCIVQGALEEPAEVAALVDAVAAELGSIDVLVNNAAVAPTAKNRHSIEDTSYLDWLSAWRQMVDVTLTGAANMTYCVARHMIEHGIEGRIVNIGSRGAFRGEPDYPAYAAAKAGLHAFGQSMGIALAPHGISVTSVAPGFISTERQASKLAGPDGPTVRSQSPFGRVGTAEEVAAAVLYLSSPDAVWASGAILDLNGASHLRS